MPLSFWSKIKKWAPRVLTIGLIVYLKKGKKMKPRDVVNAVIDDLIREGIRPTVVSVDARLNGTVPKSVIREAINARK